jgi:REP element-mobilizing transposase RayT
MMKQPPSKLDRASGTVVLEALREVCSYRSWNLLAAPIRSEHVHAIVEAEVPPEKVMNDFKSYASRALNRLDDKDRDRRRWALWKDQDVREAMRYVAEEQGEPMAVFVGDVL